MHKVKNRKGNIWWIGILLLAAFLSSCSPRESREARDVVTQADSLRVEGKMYGVDMGDSVLLAQAYETLQSWRVFYPTDFAHACYHYGRLLREKENPVEAMQVFINATHSHTHDYAILGRVNSNMGDLCHFADEFDMAYCMFEQSADCFLRNRDSIAYYYALNDMAFEKVMLADEIATFSLIKQIEKGCFDISIFSKLYETKAEWYLRTHQYDSAIYYADLLLKIKYNDPIGLLIKAQTYSYIGIKDSAVFYAEHVLQNSTNLSNRHNALYILTNDDERKNNAAIRKTAADRSDLQKKLRIQQGEFSQAVQLLQQDITRKPNLNWLYSLLATLCSIGGLLYLYIKKKQKAHQLLSQKIEALKSEDATNLALRKKQVEEKCALFANSPTIKVDLYWNNYVMLCKCVDTHFFMLAEKLKQKHIFNEQEVRLCVLVLLNMSRNQIADILPYAQNGVGKLKYRVSKKIAYRR